MAQFPAKLGFRPVLAKCTEEDIRSFEIERGIRFPDDFRDFLLQWNGGSFLEKSPTRQVDFPVDPDDFGIFEDHQSIKFIAGVCPKPCFVSLADLQRGFHFDERVPNQYVAVGLDSLSLHVCLCCAGADRGKVFCWDSFWDPDPEETLHQVANSFEDFWESLYQSDPDVSWDEQVETRPTSAERMYEPKLGFRPLLAECFPRDIQQAENWLEIEFPPDYRLFLEEWNGGYFASNVVGCDVNGNRVTIDALFGVGPHHTRLHVHDYCTTDYFVKRLPHCSAVIGKTVDFQLIILLCQNDPGIYVTREPSNAIHVEKFGLLKVADRFDEFWHALKTTD